jgi:UDP-glucose 4-epimerase
MKQRNWQCDISPLRNELGFTPQWDLERGVRASVEWYKKEKWL